MSNSSVSRPGGSVNSTAYTRTAHPFAEDERADVLAKLRQDLVQKFPGAALSHAVVGNCEGSPSHENRVIAQLYEAPFLWVEVGLGDGGLSWLVGWTLLRLAADSLERPALWVDTHSTYGPGDLLELEGRLVVVRPADPHEAHIVADIAVRSGSFCLVALEMHRALHPTPLGRLSRLVRGDGAALSASRLVVWGEPPPFLAPPSGVSRTTFGNAVIALMSNPTQLRSRESTSTQSWKDPYDIPKRLTHTTDRLRAMARVADRRTSTSDAEAPGRIVDSPFAPEPARPTTALLPLSPPSFASSEYG